MLASFALFLAAAVLFVPIFKRLGLGAVLGYMAGGVAIGPWGMGWITDVHSILHFSEFGVVLLLFLIGLELQPSRLWTLRKSVFGLGGAQVLLTGLALTAAGRFFGLTMQTAVVAGFGLAMSSTAFVLQMLAERGELVDHHGRAAFSILLFQDLAVIPFLAIIPMLTGEGRAEVTGAPFWLSTAKAVAAIVVVILGGRYALRPLLRVLASTKVAEIFTAAALLVVVVSALALDAVGLSMSLGAFLAGVLLADSEYRHELQADIEPFKGLLLGLFFIAVGMSANLGMLMERPVQLLGLTVGLIVTKSLVLYVCGRVYGLGHRHSTALACALSQGGEFAFVLFSVATAAGVLRGDLRDLLIMAVTLSMVATPLLYLLQARLQREDETLPFDEIVTPTTPVIIAGFGPSGQIVGRVLRLSKIPFTVLERNWEHVDFMRQFGVPVFYSDATRVEVMRAAHADAAKVLVIAIPDQEVSMHIAEMARKHFPHLALYAFAKDRRHAMHLIDLGVHVIRRTYLSSLELTRQLLIELGTRPEQAERALETFRRHDEETLAKQQAVFRDEQQLVQSARDAARELQDLFSTDRLDRRDS